MTVWSDLPSELTQLIFRCMLNGGIFHDLVRIQSVSRQFKADTEVILYNLHPSEVFARPDSRSHDTRIHPFYTSHLRSRVGCERGGDALIVVKTRETANILFDLSQDLENDFESIESILDVLCHCIVEETRRNPRLPCYTVMVSENMALNSGSNDEENGNERENGKGKDGNEEEDHDEDDAEHDDDDDDDIFQHSCQCYHHHRHHAMRHDNDHLLTAAICLGDVELIELVLELELPDVDVNYEAMFLGHPLTLAAWKNQTITIELLLEYGSRLSHRAKIIPEYEEFGPMNETLFEGNALQAACCGGHLEMVKLLIDEEHKHSCDEEDCECFVERLEERAMAIFYAISRKHEQVVKFLLEDDFAEYTFFEQMSLEIAITAGSMSLTQLFLDRGANIHAWRRPVYKSALEAACYWHFWDIAKLLIDRGAYEGCNQKNYGRCLCRSVIHGHAEVLQMLLAKLDKGSVLLNAKQKLEFGTFVESGTPCFWAAEHGHSEIFHLLVGKGAKPSLKELRLAHKNGIECTNLMKSAHKKVKH